MPRIAALALVAAQFCAGAALAEIRCGYLNNPTPGNNWLTDGEGDWIMTTQGDDRDPGMDAIGDFSAREFVTTNGAHGYACGCIDGAFDAKAMTVVKIERFRQKPLSACRKDKKLKAPE
jgi:hypothetical protein